MFTRIAERLGILDVVAPRSEIKDSSNKTGSSTPSPQEALDERMARKIQEEEDIRYKKIRSQYEAEMQAEKFGSFAKKQRCLYHHKATGKNYNAFIVAAHHDDDPTQPYYVSSHCHLDLNLSSTLLSLLFPEDASSFHYNFIKFLPLKFYTMLYPTCT